MMCINDRQFEKLQAEYCLSYHIPYAFKAEQLCGLRGKRVLEVGGSLPKKFVFDELQVKQWVSIEEPSYWHEIKNGGGTPPTEPTDILLNSIDDYSNIGDHVILAGGVEDLPTALERHFDVVFSIAAFEHILMLPLALERMFAALRPGGKLFTMFSPIWSAYDGHHLPTITDKSGTTFDFHRSPIPPWGHLLMAPPQLYKYLLSKTDSETATRIVYYTYHSQHINRLFSEDYFVYIQDSQFSIEKLLRTFEVTIPRNIQKTLLSRYPGHQYFANNGLTAVLYRPE